MILVLITNLRRVDEENGFMDPIELN